MYNHNHNMPGGTFTKGHGKSFPEGIRTTAIKLTTSFVNPLDSSTANITNFNESLAVYKEGTATVSFSGPIAATDCVCHFERIGNRVDLYLGYFMANGNNTPASYTTAAGAVPRMFRPAATQFATGLLMSEDVNEEKSNADGILEINADGTLKITKKIINETEDAIVDMNYSGSFTPGNGAGHANGLRHPVMISYYMAGGAPVEST